MKHKQIHKESHIFQHPKTKIKLFTHVFLQSKQSKCDYIIRMPFYCCEVLFSCHIAKTLRDFTPSTYVPAACSKLRKTQMDPYSHRTDTHIIKFRIVDLKTPGHWKTFNLIVMLCSSITMYLLLEVTFDTLLRHEKFNNVRRKSPTCLKILFECVSR